MQNIVLLFMIVGVAEIELNRLEEALAVCLMKRQDEDVPGCVCCQFSLKYAEQECLPKSVVLWRHSGLNDFASVIRETGENTEFDVGRSAALGAHPRFDFATGTLVKAECKTYRLFANTQLDGHVLIDRLTLAQESALVEFVIDAEAYQSQTWGLFLTLCQDELATGFGTSTLVYRVRKRVPLRNVK